MHIDLSVINSTIQTNFSRRNAVQTQGQYKSTESHYIIFCKLYDKDINSINNIEERLCQFLTWKQLCVGIGWSAMRGHLYAVRSFYAENNIHIDVDSKSMRKAHGLIRAEKLRNPGGDGAKPVTIDMLKKWIKCMSNDKEYNKHDSNVWIASWLSAFFGMKRISEYTFNPDKLKNVLVQDLSFEFEPTKNEFEQSSYCILNRRKGKTYQFGGDLYAVYLCTCNDGPCALCTFIELIKLRTINKKYDQIKGNNLLEFSDGSVLNKYSAGKMIKDICRKTNIDPEKISGHSMRKGGAQWAVKKGMPATSIMKQADWRSYGSFKRYNDNVSRENQIKMFKDKLSK